MWFKSVRTLRSTTNKVDWVRHSSFWLFDWHRFMNPLSVILMAACLTTSTITQFFHMGRIVSGNLGFSKCFIGTLKCAFKDSSHAFYFHLRASQRTKMHHKNLAIYQKFKQTKEYRKSIGLFFVVWRCMWKSKTGYVENVKWFYRY